MPRTQPNTTAVRGRYRKVAIISSCSKATSRTRWPKPSSSCSAPFPPQAQTIDKEHGRIEERKLWCVPTDPETVGLAGAAQLIRIQRHVQIVRKGKVIKDTTNSPSLVISFCPDEATPRNWPKG